MIKHDGIIRRQFVMAGLTEATGADRKASFGHSERMSVTAESQTLVRAMVFRGPGQPFEMRMAPSRPPGLGEVRVRIRCCTLCGSDLHTYQGHRSTPAPTVLGHEILGEVESLGPGEAVTDHAGEPLRVGQRVTWSIAASCHACFYCEHDLPQKCEHLFKYGHESLDSETPLSGGLAEHCLLTPGTTIVKLPEALPDTVACPVNCATATVAAAMRLAEVGPGQTILVQGLGALGLTAAAMARELGAVRVIGCDTNPRRLELSRRFGVSDPVDGRMPAAVEQAVWQCTAGRGVDAALELSGAIEAMREAVPLLRIGGRFVLVGSVFKTPELALEPEMVVRRLLTIRGLHNYTPRDLVAAVAFLAENHGRYPFDELIEGNWPLEEAASAFEHAIATRALRVAVRP